jgi:epoxyqueuosine reductase
MRGEVGEFQAAVTVDTAKALEKAWAARAGIGWVGKNSLIMHRDIGSFMFLALVIVDFELEYDHPVPDSCAHCTLCIDACPTGAIVEPRVIDARKCISYLTIELKGNLPIDKKSRLDNWIFGCDICQDVCPWNRKALPHGEPQFEAPNELYQMTAVDWLNLTRETFNRLFKSSPLERSGYTRLRRNLDFVSLHKVDTSTSADETHLSK